jgi:excisionase family DNA binding protein
MVDQHQVATNRKRRKFNMVREPKAGKNAEDGETLLIRENSRRFATVSELAIYFHVKESKIRSMIFHQQVPGIIRIGRLIRFDLDQIDVWLEKMKAS